MPGNQEPEYAGGAPNGEGAAHGMGHACTIPVQGSCGGHQLGGVGGAGDGAGGVGAGGAEAVLGDGTVAGGGAVVVDRGGR